MEIELVNGATKAIIDPLGGWMTNLADTNGDILFPRRKLNTPEGMAKNRGGCHVCVPNYGPGGESGQPQHGYGRLKEWTISDRMGDSVLLTLSRGEGDYVDMASEISYQLTEHALVMTLELTNNGQKTLEVAPAFHPYFALSTGEENVKVDGQTRALDDFLDAEFIAGETHTLETQTRSLTLCSEEFTKWALWTDRLGAYVCMEPTQNGFAFSENTEKKQLAADEKTLWKWTLEW